jgi:hypothetical protein
MISLMTLIMQPYSHLIHSVTSHAVRVILMMKTVLMSIELMSHLIIDVVTLSALIIMTDFLHIWDLASRTSLFFLFCGHLIRYVSR